MARDVPRTRCWGFWLSRQRLSLERGMGRAAGENRYGGVSGVSVSPMARSGQLAGIRLMRAGLARMVAGVRTAVAVAAVTSALIGIERPLSWWWLIPVLTGVTGWTAWYAFTAWTRGLRTWLIGVDLLLACLLCLAVRKLVPAQEIPG